MIENKSCIICGSDKSLFEINNKYICSNCKKYIAENSSKKTEAYKLMIKSNSQFTSLIVKVFITFSLFFIINFFKEYSYLYIFLVWAVTIILSILITLHFCKKK